MLVPKRCHKDNKMIFPFTIKDRDRAESTGGLVAINKVIGNRSFIHYLLMLLTAGSLLLVVGCAHHMPIAADSAQALYIAEENEKKALHRFAPVFRVYDYQRPYNRIGRPVAVHETNDEERIAIDTDHPVIYVEKRTFSTLKDTYTNLIYRVHFPSVPFSLIPFNLTAGKNPGLIIVITLNRQEEPVLVTSVHTCGCYKALVATTALPDEALPARRQKKPGRFKVFGEHLPGVVNYRAKPEPRLLVDLRPGVHRVMDLEIIDREALENRFLQGLILKMPMEPSENLTRLTLNGHETSFFRQKGIMKDHVKGAVKPLETLFLSWFSLDLFVGTDKIYGSSDNPFYTSLKPWNRRKSDMNDFARFLDFWGWDL